MTASRGAARARLLIATGSPGKLAEFRALLGSEFAVSSLREFPDVALPPEGDDYAENAAAKARAAAHGSGLPALADDSGIEVAALQGAPGARSARYGGEGLDDRARSALLLRALAGLGEGAPRAARFVCVAALAWPGGELATARGECAGRLLEAPRGASGFGYDPVFAPEGEERSFAELAPAEKDRISHRARALAALRPALDRVARSA